MARSPQDVIRDMRTDLENDEKAYRKARGVFEDPDRVFEFLNSLKTRLAPLMAYNPNEQPAHSAVAVVASMQERLAGVFQDLRFIEDYESRKAELTAHIKAHVGMEDEPEGTSESLA